MPKKNSPLPMRRLKREAELHYQRSDLAQDRVGKKPIERLRWLIDFAKKPVSSLDPGERIPLGYELRAIASGSPKSEKSRAASEGRASIQSLGPLDDALIREIHTEIQNGLKRVFSEGSPGSGGWNFNLPDLFNVYRTSPLKSKRIAFGTLSQFGLGREKDAILYGVADILLDNQRMLRACAECTSPFIPVRRQEYCSTSCSQKARDRRRKKKPK
jgi:hypothetical protein